MDMSPIAWAINETWNVNSDAPKVVGLAFRYKQGGVKYQLARDLEANASSHYRLHLGVSRVKTVSVRTKHLKECPRRKVGYEADMENFTPECACPHVVVDYAPLIERLHRVAQQVYGAEMDQEPTPRKLCGVVLEDGSLHGVGLGGHAVRFMPAFPSSLKQGAEAIATISWLAGYTDGLERKADELGSEAEESDIVESEASESSEDDEESGSEAEEDSEEESGSESSDSSDDELPPLPRAKTGAKHPLKDQ